MDTARDRRWGLTRALRADPAHASTLLVAVTGYTQAEDKRKSAEAGFDPHLGKPVTLEQLESIVACCDKRPSDRDVGPDAQSRSEPGVPLEARG